MQGMKYRETWNATRCEVPQDVLCAQRHRAVGKSSLEQHFCKSAAITFIM